MYLRVMRDAFFESGGVDTNVELSLLVHELEVFGMLYPLCIAT